MALCPGAPAFADLAFQPAIKIFLREAREAALVQARHPPTTTPVAKCALTGGADVFDSLLEVEHRALFGGQATSQLGILAHKLFVGAVHELPPFISARV